VERERAQTASTNNFTGKPFREMHIHTHSRIYLCMNVFVMHIHSKIERSVNMISGNTRHLLCQEGSDESQKA